MIEMIGMIGIDWDGMEYHSKWGEGLAVASAKK